MKKAALLIAIAAFSIAVGCEDQIREQRPSITFAGDATPSFRFSDKEESKALEFDSALEWTASVSSGGKDWITLDKTRGSAGHSSIQITVSANSGTASRSSYVTLTSKSYSTTVSRTIEVTQSQRDVLSLDKYSVSLPAEGGEFQVTISSNVPVSIDLKDSWTHRIETKAMKDSVAHFSVDANALTGGRSMQIVFSGGRQDTEKTLTVNQAGMPSPQVDNAFTRTCTDFGIYDLSSPDTPVKTYFYEEFKDQLAYGKNSSGRTFRIQSVTAGTMISMTFGSTSRSIGTSGSLTLSGVGISGIETRTFDVTVDKYSSGRLWLEDSSAHKGFIIATE